MASAVLTFTVTVKGNAFNAIPPTGVPGLPTTNYTLVAADFAAQAEELRQKVRDLFLAIDSNADADTTVVVTIA